MRVEIEKFNKPTHETDGKFYINLQVEKVERIKKAKKILVVKLPQGYCRPVNPKELLKNGNKTEAVFLFPNNPMRLVGGYYELLPKEQQEAAEYNQYFWENY